MLVNRDDASGIDDLSSGDGSHGSRSESHTGVLLDASGSSGGLGGVLDLLTGNAVGDLSVLWVGLVDLAVGLVFEGFNGLQVQSQTARSTLQADFVPEGTAGGDTLVGVGSLATSRALFSLSVAWNK